jgi:Tol biopolymer transport system component
MRLNLLLLFLPFIFFSHPINAQYFGKNKVQYKNFDWYFIQSEHFDIYFYEGGKDIAEFTAQVAEEAYKQISRDWKFLLRNRVVFVVYKSHNDWQQTNVVISYLEEGIGGVTELYKNRIVVPFEGSYEQFRHVIHHELVHAVMNDMIYGGTIQSLVMGEVAPVPLWFAEGLAEFQSQGWTTGLDMIVRDAVLHGTLPPLQYLDYYLVYQGGASVFKYIAKTYGRSKVGELLGKMRGRVTYDRVLKSAIGMDYEEFTKRWHKHLKEEYWPEIANRDEPFEISRQLTDHEKVPNYLNVSPAISPNGDKIAFISDRKGYQNIYLMSTIEGEITKILVRGQRSESFEELHFLRPGMSFSPDGKSIVFAAKSGRWDAIYTVDVKDRNTTKYEIKLDGIFTTAWSPDGDRIAFVGNKDGQSDLYIYRLSDKSLTRLTNDEFTDDHPSWSPDGNYLCFVSDRKQFLNGSLLAGSFDIGNFDFEKRDVYTINVNTKEMKRITATEWQESTPLFSPDSNKLVYTSDKNGIFNLFVHNLNTNDSYPVTNVISGIFQIGSDKNANKMVYTSFYHAGFDLYLLNSPLQMEPKELEDTKFVTEMRSTHLPVYARNWSPYRDRVPGDSLSDGKVPGGVQTDYSKYVFSRHRIESAKNDKPITLNDDQFQESSGEYKVNKYKLKFSPDIFTGYAGYNTFFGFQGYTTLAFSDLLGDHKIFLSVNLLSDIKNSDLNITYYYLKKRINYGIGGYHLAYFFFDSFRGLLRYRNFGSTLIISYPFSKFRRIDFTNIWYNVYLEYLDLPFPTEKISTYLPTVSYVHDNVIWGYTGPVDGSRYSVDVTISPKYSDNSMDFQTIKFDYRKYFMMSREYQFAFRLTAGASFGQNAQRFYVGGIDNWINRKYRGGKRFDNIQDVFFSEFVTPLRGAYYYELEGSRYFLSNFEFRFPLIKYLGLGFPPISLFNIRGVMFYDIGGAMDDFSDFQVTTRLPNGNTIFRDVSSGFGIGSRIYFLYFLFRFDIAWRFDLNRVSKPVYYLSLGADL